MKDLKEKQNKSTILVREGLGVWMEAKHAPEHQTAEQSPKCPMVQAYTCSMAPLAFDAHDRCANWKHLC